MAAGWEKWKNWNKKWDILYLLLIVGVVSLPLMAENVLCGSSLAAVLSRIKVMSRNIGKTFPLRLGTLTDMDYGYSAVSFQADVFYLIPVLFYRIGMGLGGAYKWTLFLFHLLTTVISYVSFEKCSGRREVGLVGSMLYTWCPYRISEAYLAGDLGEIAAWTFLPIIVLGLKRLYTEDRVAKSYDRLWVTLAWGFSLVAVSSTVILFAATVLTGVTFLVMGRETLQRKTLRVIGKTIVAVLCVNAWFLVPMLLRLRDVSAVAPMLLQDVRSRGMYPVQYLMTFFWGYDGVNLSENGLWHAQAMGPGIVVTGLVLCSLWDKFTGAPGRGRADAQTREMQFERRLPVIAAVLMFLSSNLFPWDMLQNRNMLCSIVLALLYTPAKLGIVADTYLILAACIALPALLRRFGEKAYGYILLVTAAISFGTTEFLMDKLRITGRLVSVEGLEELAELPFPPVAGESLIWRMSEAVSVAALVVCAAMCFVRRRRSAKRV